MSAQEQPEGSSARPLTDLALVCISQAWPLVPQRWPFNSQDFIGNSPYCLPKDSHYVSLENLISDQLVIPRVLELSFVLWFEAAICDNCVHIREVRVIVTVRELDTFLAFSLSTTKPLLWKRYIDDVFRLWNRSKTFVQRANSFNLFIVSRYNHYSRLKYQTQNLYSWTQTCYALQRDGDVRILDFSSVSGKRKRIRERRSTMPPMNKFIALPA